MVRFLINNHLCESSCKIWIVAPAMCRPTKCTQGLGYFGSSRWLCGKGSISHWLVKYLVFWEGCVVAWAPGGPSDGQGIKRWDQKLISMLCPCLGNPSFLPFSPLLNLLCFVHSYPPLVVPCPFVIAHCNINMNIYWQIIQVDIVCASHQKLGSVHL